MPQRYVPYTVSEYMSRYGYWVVTVSVSPWQRMSVMIAARGITREQARNLASDVTAGMSGSKETS